MADVRLAFNAKNWERLPSKEIVATLIGMEEARWRDIKGKPLDQNGLVRYLKVYGVKPKGLRIGNKTPRGYERADFEDVWNRYIPSTPAGGATGATP